MHRPFADAERRSLTGEPCATESLPFSPSPFSPEAGSRTAPTTIMQNQPVQTVDAPTQPVVVAAADLQLGAELKKDDLQVVRFPPGQTPEGTFAKPAEVIGRGLIVPVVKNEPILNAKLASKEAGVRTAAGDSRGHARGLGARQRSRSAWPATCCRARASTSSRRASPTDSRADMTSKVVLSNVQVLTAGTRMEQDTGRRQADAGDRRDAAGESGAVRTAGAGEHRRQDSARAAQPARPGCAGRHPASSRPASWVP